MPDRFSEVTLADGLDAPTAVAYAPDGRLFIAEKPGRLRVVSSEGRLRVEVALRTRGKRCRSWSASRGALGRTHARCDRPRWMRASLTWLGFGSWLWQAHLRGPLRRGSYVVSTRAVDSRGKVVAGVRSALVRIR